MTVNDRIFSSLVDHGGNQVNERVYNYLGSLGYTGTISDRLAKYEHNGKKGWQALIEGFGLSGSAGVLRQELFGDGQDGVMYVPQPTYLGQQVLFQDAAGTTPVTADGDPVRLMLDRSKGLVLGPELVTNGGFDEGLTGWSIGGNVTASLVDGEVEFTGSGFASSSSGNWLYSEAPVTTGQRLRTSFYATYVEGGGRLEIGAGYNESLVISPEENGGTKKRYSVDYSSEFTISAGGAVVFTASTGSVWRIDNVSVRELPGAHGTQSVSSARPLHSDTPPLQVYDDVDDQLDVVLPSIAAATVATATPTGVVIDYPVDLSGGSYTISESHSGIIIREGELTANEQQKVTDFLNELAGT